MTFGEKVKIVREKTDLSQEKLAVQLGVSFSTVNRWEKGHVMPSYLAQEKFEQFCISKKITFDNK